MPKRKNFLTQDNLEEFIVVLFFVLLFAIQILAIFWEVEEKQKKSEAKEAKLREIEQRLEEIEKYHDKRK